MSGAGAKHGAAGLVAIVLILGLGALWWATRERTRPNIVLISIDTVRADHLNAYGYDRGTSPRIAELARTGVLFENAYSQAPWTLPALASMNTSLYPSEHNATGVQTALGKEVVTLAEALSAEGYFTMGVVAHGFAGRKHGMAQGFDRFDETQDRGHLAVTSEPLNKIAARFLTEVDERPWFLWVHYFDPHYAYIRHPEHGFAEGYTGKLPAKLEVQRLNRARHRSQISADDLAYIRAVYDEEIAHTDRWIGDLLDKLPVGEEDRPTVTIVTADHGEYFLERGRFFHGKDVYDELVAVPLVIGGDLDDDLRGLRVAEPVGLVSVPRTVMELAGIGEHGFGGVDLLAVASGDADPGYVFTEGSYAWGDDERKTAVLFDRWKLIHNHDDDSWELYDLEADPRELANRWEERGEEVTVIKRHLADMIARFGEQGGTAAETVELDEETIKKLRSLGYVQ